MGDPFKKSHLLGGGPGRGMDIYCAFHKHANSEVQKPTDDCAFCCRQSS